LFILQEVSDDKFSVFTEDTLRVELDTIDWVLLVLDTHYFSVVSGFSGDFEAIRD
jgi:hypothetical protein